MDQIQRQILEISRRSEFVTPREGEMSIRFKQLIVTKIHDIMWNEPEAVRRNWNGVDLHYWKGIEARGNFSTVHMIEWKA